MRPLGPWIPEQPLGPRSWLARSPRGRAVVQILPPGDHAARLQELSPVPGLARPLEILADDQGPCLVREWIEGQPLAGPAAGQGDALPLDGRVALACQVAALVEGFPEGVRLYDLRPSHLVRGADGRLVLVDPGWSPAGTPGYAAPEQHQKADPGPECLRYQLGATLCEILTGRPPEDALALLLPGVERPRAEGEPPAVEALLDGLLDPHPRDRPSPAQARQVLETWAAALRSRARRGQTAGPAARARGTGGLLPEGSRTRQARTAGPAGPGGASSGGGRPSLGARLPWRTLVPLLVALLVLAAGVAALRPPPPTPPPPPPPAGPQTPAEPLAPRAADGKLPAWWLNPRDRSRMVLVPAGEFQMGGGSEPVRTVDLEAFYIDRFEVTNARFARFVEATGYKVQGAWARYATPDRADHPAIAVSWFDADAYCRWAGGRLPREEEWEKAARGGDARLYPWGNRWDPLRLNSLEMGPGATTPVGAYPGGASPYGVEDMAGNVWEWTDSWLGGSAVELLRVVRGGSRSDPEEMCRTYARRGIYPEAGTLVNSGFRCVVDPEP